MGELIKLESKEGVRWEGRMIETMRGDRTGRGNEYTNVRTVSLPAWCYGPFAVYFNDTAFPMEGNFTLGHVATGYSIGKILTDELPMEEAFPVVRLAVERLFEKWGAEFEGKDLTRFPEGITGEAWFAFWKEQGLMIVSGNAL